MANHLADRIRDVFRSSVASVVPIDPESVMLETTLIRDGMYCGRRFAIEGYTVVYFVEEKQIKLYGPAGNIEQSCSLDEFLDDRSETRRVA